MNSDAVLRASGKSVPGNNMGRSGRGGSADRGRGRGMDDILINSFKGKNRKIFSQLLYFLTYMKIFIFLNNLLCNILFMPL